jgi:hypothetical protein
MLIGQSGVLLDISFSSRAEPASMSLQISYRPALSAIVTRPSGIMRDKKI